MSTKKIAFEKKILSLAEPLLIRLYGDIDWDPEQLDRPDAAFIALRPPKRLGRHRNPAKVGIEVTTVDPIEYLAYDGDKKFGKELISKQIDDAINHGIDGDRPTKKFPIKTHKNYISDGIQSKLEKYQDYKDLGKYKEVILLCHSKVLSPLDTQFIEGINDWTNYLLSQQNFPYDRVIFVHETDGNPIKVYDRENRLKREPAPYAFDKSVITPTEFPMFLMGKTYNLRQIGSRAPLISPRPQNKNEKNKSKDKD